MTSTGQEEKAAHQVETQDQPLITPLVITMVNFNNTYCNNYVMFIIYEHESVLLNIKIYQFLL